MRYELGFKPAIQATECVSRFRVLLTDYICGQLVILDKPHKRIVAPQRRKTRAHGLRIKAEYSRCTNPTTAEIHQPNPSKAGAGETHEVLLFSPIFFLRLEQVCSWFAVRAWSR